MLYTENLSKNIKKLREEYNLTQDQLADRLHVSSQAISKWETGENLPTLSCLIEMSKMFYVSLDALVCGIDGNDATGLAGIVNHTLNRIYYEKNHQGEVSGLINDIVSLTLPLTIQEGDYMWLFAARNLLKATIYAMLEDPKLKPEAFNVASIKKTLMLSNFDDNDRFEKLTKYFSTKSEKCREYASGYLGTARPTASSIFVTLATYLNMLDA